MKKVFVLVLLPFLSVRAQDTKEIISRLKADVPVLMQKGEIPGLSIALIRDGQLVWTQPFGVINNETRKPTGPQTMYEAASLSKVVFAYGVMKLVDEGKLSLDVPLNQYLGNNYEVGDDPRLNKITARRVLTHSAGFPNWRSNGKGPLPIQFEPGERFSYSGEGFVYLSRVVEKLTGQPLEAYYQQHVLIPLGMLHSSFVWQDAFDSLVANRHSALGKVTFRDQGRSFNAAASLRTTVEDYGRFVAALLRGDGLKPATQREMFSPQINVKPGNPELSWGVGLGMETVNGRPYFWHWGDQGDAKAYMKADIAAKNAVVYFANSANGLSITKEILDDALGGTHPGVAWLNYERYDSPAKKFLALAKTGEVAKAVAAYEEHLLKHPADSISEAGFNSIGYVLMGNGKLDDALAIFIKNADTHPYSANVWDSLAEAYANKGDKPNAIRFYEKALALDPKSQSAADMLKKLKEQ